MKNTFMPNKTLERRYEFVSKCGVSNMRRYPSGWGGAAALLLDNHQIVTSIAPETSHDALSECIELGAILEAHKQNRKVTHSLCLERKEEKRAIPSSYTVWYLPRTP